MLSWDSGVHTLSFLRGSDLERTEALWSSGASLILEMNCQFIFAEPGSESHSCVYRTAPDSLLLTGNRQTPEAAIRSPGHSGPTFPPIAVHTLLHSSQAHWMPRPFPIMPGLGSGQFFFLECPFPASPLGKLPFNCQGPVQK